MSPTVDRVHHGLTLHQSGRWNEADAVYRDILRSDPQNADVLYLLGTMHYQRGAFASAKLFLKRALSIAPSHAEAQNNLGLVLWALNDPAAASQCFEQAIQQSPRYADAHYNLGNLHREQGAYQKAVDCYRFAVDCRPEFAEAWDNLGLALRELGQCKDAIAAHQRAIALMPSSALAWNNLGAAFKHLQDYPAAENAFREALVRDGKLVAARSNLGITLAHLRQWTRAETECRLAVQDAPNNATACHNLGLVLFLQGKNEEAKTAFETAVRLNPASADAWNNLGSACFRTNHNDQAIEAYKRAIEIRPGVVTYKNLGSVLEQVCDWSASRDAFQSASKLRSGDPLLDLRAVGVCPSIFRSREQIDAFRTRLDTELDRCIDMAIRRPVAELVDLDLRPSFQLQFHGYNDLAIRQKYAAVFRHCVPHETDLPTRSGRPTVGFCVSAGHEYAFCRSIGEFFRLFRYDQWRPVIVCHASSMARIQSVLRCNKINFLSLPNDLEGIVDAIQSMHFDMLYHWEIATGALNYFLPMLRLAPMQCTSWGIQVTSGIPAVAHYLSSKWIENDEAQSHYSERLVRLDTMLTYQRRMALPDRPAPRATLGLPSNATLYFCPQQLGKFHPDFDPVIAAILRSDPNGRLVVTCSSFDAETLSLQARFAESIPDVIERIHWVEKQTGSAYASLVLAADVFLDPMPFGGVNTTYDAFSAAKVVVTLPSDQNRGRYTSACYRRMGITEPVASTIDDYIATALRLGADSEYRRELEAKIGLAREVLFEQSAAATELEQWMLEAIECFRANQ